MRQQRPITLTFSLILVFLALQASPLPADTASAAPPDQLGKVNFPTSCTVEMQPTIEKGVALLHSLQYKESKQTFAEAATKEPKYAMAHWGTAMALFYQRSEFPNDNNLERV